jgi:hypothetical protein
MFTRISPRSVANNLSTGARCDTNTDVCSCVEPSPVGSTTQNAASATCRFGYSPIAAPKYNDPSGEYPLKKYRSYWLASPVAEYAIGTEDWWIG